MLSHFSRVRLCATPKTAAHQAPPSLGFSRQNTGVGCHFLLQCMKVKNEREVAQSCLTLSDPMDYSLPGSSIHGIFQARVLEWGAIAFSAMSSSNCCFLTCIQVSQEAGQVVWYSHLFQKIPQFIVIHTVKGFVIDNKAERDVFLELSCFFGNPVDVGNLISGSSASSKFSLNIWNFSAHVLLKPQMENFEHCSASM